MSCKETALLFRGLKEVHEDNNYLKELSGIGIEASCVQALSFSFVNVDKLIVALENPDSYSGIIFTSPRAVEAIQRSVVDERHDCLRCQWSSLKNFAVGKVTTLEAATILGLKCQGKETGNAKLLAELIAKNASLYTKPFLFPCSNLSRDTLPLILDKAGIKVESIHVYETVGHPDLLANLSRLIAEKGVPQYVVFFSPSGLNHALPLLRANHVTSESTKFVAIGPTTAEALRLSGVEIHCVASEPNARALATAIAISRN